MKIIFMGRKKYAAKMLEWLIIQGVDVRFVCTDSQFANYPTLNMAKKYGIPVVDMEDAEKYVENNPDEIDLVISYLYWRKIREPLISKPKYGCVNFHPAILPDWRGTAGYNIAILYKLDTWGATAHYVNDKIDMGEIIRVFKFNFDYRIETAKSLEKKTQEIQMELFKSVILDILKNGKLKSIKQSPEDGIYISKKQMLDMMYVDINNITQEELDLKIRAFWFPPYSGAGFKIDGKFYTLINEQILNELQEKDTTAKI